MWRSSSPKRVCLASDTRPRRLQLTETPSARPSGNTDWQATTNLMQMYADRSEGGREAEREGERKTERDPAEATLPPCFPAHLQASDAAFFLYILTSRFTPDTHCALASSAPRAEPAVLTHCGSARFVRQNISGFILLSIYKVKSVNDYY